MGVVRYREIVDHYSISDSHPFTVVVDIHDSMVNQVVKFVEAAPDRFQLLTRRKAKPAEWLLYVGCANQVARDEFERVWG